MVSGGLNGFLKPIRLADAACTRLSLVPKSTGQRSFSGATHKAAASQDALGHRLRSAEWLADLKRINDLLRASASC
jgi:hypothetical protein